VRIPGVEPALSVEGVTKAFGGLLALVDVSFEIHPGQIIGLIGPNGAGKTTLINVVSGLIQATSGRIRLDGYDIGGWPAQRIAAVARVARTYQNIRLFAELSVLENVIVGYHSHMTTNLVTAFLRLPLERRQEREAQAAAEAILEYVGIRHLAHRLARELSYGDRRRVELARALMLRPRLLMLDEPSAGMTTGEAEQMARLISTLRQQGMAILIIEHNMRLVMGISDEVIALNFGRVIGHGPPAEVQRLPAVVEAYLGANYAAR